MFDRYPIAIMNPWTFKISAKIVYKFMACVYITGGGGG